MKKHLKGLMVVAAAVIAMGVSRSQAATIDLVANGPVTLQDAITNNDTLKVGDLLFSNFGGFTNTGAGPTAADISIFAETNVPGEPGLKFVSTLWDAFNESMDTSFSFDVTTTSGAPILADDYLSVTGSASFSSRWNVDETVETINQNNTLSDLGAMDVDSSKTVNKVATDKMNFTPPQTALHISKDIGLTSPGARGDTPGEANISDVTQGFSEVPLPASSQVGLLLLGCFGAMQAAKRMRKGAMA